MAHRVSDFVEVDHAPDGRSMADDLIAQALEARASDIHIDPTADGYQVKFRIDGLLEPVATHASAVGRLIVTRLMVTAKLLTYRPDVPQEGRATFSTTEVRISIMPTTHGPRCAVRLPAELLQPKSLDDLKLPARVLEGFDRFTRVDSGMLVVTGPAGSGKTTTIYALLAHIARSSPGLSIVTLEDPVERDLTREGIVQIEVAPFGNLTYERALRSILRQDPQVLMLGEIRDAATASIAMQAALSGHRLICTLHASTPAGALVRLLDMGVAPYQLSSAIVGIMTQRLLRRKTGEMQGYHGRVAIAELAGMNPDLRSAILKSADADALRRAYASQPDFQSISAAARELVDREITDAAEVDRVLGDTAIQ